MTSARARFDRRRLLSAILLALAFHGVLVLGVWIYERFGVQDIGAWTGPVLVKIGAPDAPESPLRDPGPSPEEPAVSEPPEEPVPESPTETPSPSADSEGEASSTASPPEPSANPAEIAQPAAEDPAPSSGGTGTTPVETSAPVAPEAPSEPLPSRVRGEEEGNSFDMNFDGSPEDVGRTAAFNGIAYYMPLPSTLSESLMAEVRSYMGMSPDGIRELFRQFWEPDFDGDWYKDLPVPMERRPEFWSLLENALGYDLSQAEYKTMGLRPVVIEFTVPPSRGAQGAFLTDIEITRRTNNPAIDRAVEYGISKWIYYNDTGKPIKGRITYRFDE